MYVTGSVPRRKSSWASGLFRGGSLEEVVLLLTLKVGGSTASGGEGARSMSSTQGQQSWCSRNRDQGATSTKLCASKSKNTRSLSIFFLSLLVSYFSYHPPSYFLPSLIILSGNAWIHLLIPPGNLLPAGWAKTLLDSLLFRYRLAAAPKAPHPP